MPKLESLNKHELSFQPNGVWSENRLTTSMLRFQKHSVARRVLFSQWLGGVTGPQLKDKVNSINAALCSPAPVPRVIPITARSPKPLMQMTISRGRA